MGEEPLQRKIPRLRGGDGDARLYGGCEKEDEGLAKSFRIIERRNRRSERGISLV